MKYLRSLSDFSIINEDMKQAKAYFIKKQKDEYLANKQQEAPEEVEGEETEEVEGEETEDTSATLTREDEAKILAMPEFREVMDLVASNNGWAMTFIKFKIEQKASKDELVALFNTITDPQNKNILKELPLKSVQKYAKIPFVEGQVPGWELLGDHISVLKAADEGKWIIGQFVKRAGIKDSTGQVIPGEPGVNQKELFKNAPQETKDQIIELAAKMHRLDPTGGLKKAFTRKLSTCKTLDIIIDGLESQIDAVGTKKAEVAEQLLQTYPGASIIWESADKMLTIYRSPNVLGETCRHTNWCLKPEGFGTGSMSAFFNYVKNGAVQFVYWDFTKPISEDNYSIMAFTVKPDGNITHAHRKDDADINGPLGSEVRDIRLGKTSIGIGTDIPEILGGFELPQYAIDDVMAALPSESAFQLLTAPIYEKLNSTRSVQTEIKELIKRTERRENRRRRGLSQEDGINSKLHDDIVATEIAFSNKLSEMQPIVYEELTDLKGGGIANIEGAKMYRVIFKDSSYMSKDSIGKVIRVNEERKRRSQRLLANARSSSKMRNMMKEALLRKRQGHTLEETLANLEVLVETITEASVYLRSL